MCWKQLAWMAGSVGAIMVVITITPGPWSLWATAFAVMGLAFAYLAGDHAGTDHRVLSFNFSPWDQVKEEALKAAYDQVDPDRKGAFSEEELAEALYAWFTADNRYLAPTDARVTS